MNTSPASLNALETWRDTPLAFDAALRARVAAHVDEAAERLSDRFYDVMLVDEQARGFLDHAVVSQRLHAAMARWLRDLFDPALGAPVLVVHFLALLELAREHLLEMTQVEEFAPIYLRLANDPGVRHDLR